MSDKIPPLTMFISAIAISSFGGLASFLRSRRKLEFRAVFAAALYSGLMGLIIALCWYNWFDGQGNLYFLLGISGLAGIGGTTFLDFIVQAFRHGGISIKITPGDGHSRSEENDDSRDSSS